MPSHAAAGSTTVPAVSLWALFSSAFFRSYSDTRFRSQARQNTFLPSARSLLALNSSSGLVTLHFRQAFFRSMPHRARITPSRLLWVAVLLSPFSLM